MKRFSFILLGWLAACSTIVGETPTETLPAVSPPTTVATTLPTTTTTRPAPTTVPAPRECVDRAAAPPVAATGSVAGDALVLSAAIFHCADDVVVAGEANLGEVVAAAQLAAALGGPLLHPHPDLAAELSRLEPRRVHLVGDVSAPGVPGAVMLHHDLGDAAAATGDRLEVAWRTHLPVTPDASTVVETIEALTARDRVTLPATSPPADPAEPVAIDPAALIEGLARPTGSEFVWLVDPSNPVALLSAAATGRAVGASVLAHPPGSLFANPRIGPALAGRPPSAVIRIGSDAPVSPWEVDVVTRGVQLPGGGFQVFPAQRPRRYVAFYGHPETRGLGALGEQGPVETLERMAPLLGEYAADGMQVIPTFEIIASIASAGPTDGDYSEESPPTAFQAWIDVAREAGAYVVLDLQPGREDFLSQARQYEELLKLPFVGLALDPEWRLKPDQVHLRQIGQVEAAEVNTVIDWLGDLVRDNGLPQKMLIVHQFQSRMIVDRETIKSRPELQVVIQMDGQGPIPTKEETYAVLTAGTEEAHWRWGWKNFFDEDSPETATPAFTIDRDPVPVFVSYQ